MVAAPATRPDASRTGETLRETSIRRPSRCTRTVSKCRTRSPRASRAMMARFSSARSGGTMRPTERPTTSCAAWPYMSSAAGFQLVMTPSRVSPITASSVEATIAARRACASSASFRSVMSMQQPT
jgi:hypothetical protein